MVESGTGGHPAIEATMRTTAGDYLRSFLQVEPSTVAITANGLPTLAAVGGSGRGGVVPGQHADGVAVGVVHREDGGPGVGQASWLGIVDRGADAPDIDGPDGVGGGENP